MVVEKSIELLGKKVKDRIRGTTGIVTSVCFDLYGCIQVIIDTQKADKEGKRIDSGWIDLKRVDIVSHKLILDSPDFNNKYSDIKQVGGPAEKPIN